MFGRLESNGNNPLPATWNSTCQPMATEVSADATSRCATVRCPCPVQQYLGQNSRPAWEQPHSTATNCALRHGTYRYKSRHVCGCQRESHWKPRQAASGATSFASTRAGARTPIVMEMVGGGGTDAAGVGDESTAQARAKHSFSCVADRTAERTRGTRVSQLNMQGEPIYRRLAELFYACRQVKKTASRVIEHSDSVVAHPA